MIHVVQLLLVFCAFGTTLGWVNDYDEPFVFECPAGRYIYWFESQHDNRKEDRIFEFQVGLHVTITCIQIQECIGGGGASMLQQGGFIHAAAGGWGVCIHAAAGGGGASMLQQGVHP